MTRKIHQPPPRTPAHRAHEAICCDDLHAASASSSGSSTPSTRKSSGGHTVVANKVPTHPPSEREGSCTDCHPCPAGDVVCCNDTQCDSPSCEGSALECCEDPACDQAVDDDTCEDCHPPQIPSQPLSMSHGGGQDETEKALSEWMCSKEGCEAIAQYLKVCTEHNCCLPIVHPEPTLTLPQMPEPPPPSAHFHITPHTHPQPCPSSHCCTQAHAHPHIFQPSSQMLPPAFPAAASHHPTPVTSPILSWPMSSSSSSSTPHSLLAPPPPPAIDNAFTLPSAGWSEAAQANHICHWQNCHLTFPSMPDLLAHVATDHLGAPGFSAPLLETSHQALPNLITTAPTASNPIMAQTATQAPAPSSASSVNFSGLGFNPFDLSNAGAQEQTLPPSFQTAAAHHGTSDAMDLDKLFGGSDGLFSCLWDDCFPLPEECSADPNEACPPHPVQSQHQPAAPSSVNTSLLHSDHTHSHSHAHAHSHAHHTAAPGTESFSPQTMLRHVLEEHLGVPSDILGWEELLSTPLSASTADHLDQAHQKLHARPHNALFPTPPSSRPTASPPLVPHGLVCQWPGCTHSEPFADSAELMDHLSDEHIGRGQDHYVCKWGECQHVDEGKGRSFRSRQKVLRHLQSHTGHKPFICDECGQAFGEAAPLAAHVRRHAQEKPFVCEHLGCGKRFAISSSLTIHMRTHNGEKPFVCPHCGKGFVEASNLTKHIRTHTGERPFACPHPGCGRRFPRPDQLKRHMGVHEKDKVKMEVGAKRRKSSV